MRTFFGKASRFSSGSRNDAREIFEFYLAANNILRDDERRWFGFEMHEVAAKGEQILRNMSGAPPLVYFALGALYNKMGDHQAAVSRLSYVIENESADESKFMYPSPELRNYVRVLRKLERDPAEAPLTSGAVRALERARKNRGKILLDQSRDLVTAENRRKSEEVTEKLLVTAEVAEPLRSAEEKPEREPAPQPATSLFENGRPADETKPQENGKRTRKKPEEDPFANRKPISEVLHDIYDRNVQ